MYEDLQQKLQREIEDKLKAIENNMKQIEKLNGYLETLNRITKKGGVA